MQLDLVEKLFLRTVIDLRARIESDDGYDLIIASALLRKLLIDSTTLVALANRRPRLKLKFPVIEDHPSPPQGWVLRGYSGDKVGRLDGFLNSRVAYLDGDPYTAYEVITTCANSFGGVHAGEITQPRLRKLIQTRFADIGFIIESGAAENPLMVEVWQIAGGALRGLDPLYRHLAQFAPRRRPILNWIFQKLFGVPIRNLPVSSDLRSSSQRP